MQLLLRDTYLQMIKNSVGSNLFRNLYAEIDGTKRDILRDGNLSCNFFVSSILWHFKLLKEGPHANTVGFLRDLEASGWYKVEEPREGDVILWEPKLGISGETHPHTGFYIGNHRVITNNDTVRTPIEEDLTYGTNENGTPKRAITAIYTHPFLK